MGFSLILSMMGLSIIPLLMFLSGYKTEKIMFKVYRDQGRHQDFNPTKAKIQNFNQSEKKTQYIKGFFYAW
jgi:hypothetical protein